MRSRIRPSPSVGSAAGHLAGLILAAIDPLELLGRLHAARRLLHDDRRRDVDPLCFELVWHAFATGLHFVALALDGRSSSQCANVDKELGDYGDTIRGEREVLHLHSEGGGVLTHSEEF